MLDKWKRAVVHLEGAADSQAFDAQDEIFADFTSGRITNDEYLELILSGTRDIRYQGTAIFVAKGDQRYLVTARHVLHDENDAANGYLQKVSVGNDMGQPFIDQMINNSIFKIIFRVSSLDEMIKFKEPARGFMMNLGAGPVRMRPYTFSNEELDLAVISLNDQAVCSGFLAELNERGYIPVDFDDIADEPSLEGADIFTVGYPGSTSVVASIEAGLVAQSWSSSAVSLPVFAFGKIAMLHSELDWFWGDISIYPGNSGGPIVEGDKLVGIVSANATIAVENTAHRMRIPFAKLIKSSHIKYLIAEQEKKDLFSQIVDGVPPSSTSDRTGMFSDGS